MCETTTFLTSKFIQSLKWTTLRCSWDIYRVVLVSVYQYGIPNSYSYFEWTPPITMSNTIDKLIIITFSIVTNPYPCHLYMFITENYSSKFLIMSFWAPVLKSPAENDIPKKCLNTSQSSQLQEMVVTLF